jgi:uroporphyrinogen decarboxylase
MNSRERILTTLNHEEPDKVPIDSWITPEIAEVLVRGFNLDLKKDPFALPKALGNDLLYLSVGFCDGYSSTLKPERQIGPNLFQDQFGIKWKQHSQQFGSYCEFVEHPLANIKNYDTYKLPDPLIAHKKDIELYEGLVKNEGKEYAILGGCACTMFEACWYLRGLENFLTDLYLNKDFAIELLDLTMDYSLKLSKKLVGMGVDIIWWGDDVAHERGPYIDPKIFRELIKPRYAYMVSEIKKVNKDIKIAFHCDGKVDWAIEDFIELGFDILNPLQSDVNNTAEIKKKYGKKLTFWGNVDTRRVLNIKTFKEVAEEVRRTIEILSPGGGHILCTNHTIQSGERAVDNTLGYYAAANHYRNYPLNVKKVDQDQKIAVYMA